MLFPNLLARFKQILQTNKKVLSNAFFLFIMQMSNYIVPLITVPYLVRSIGIDLYGVIAFALAFMTYFQIATDFGFNLSATQEISLYRDDAQKISEIYCTVIITKFTIALACGIILMILLFSVNLFSQEREFYVILYLSLLATIFLPVWFFQGLEEMGYITLFNFISKIVFGISIFVFIKAPKDYTLYSYFHFISNIVIAIVSTLIVFRKFKIKLVPVSVRSVFYNLNKAKEIFFSQAAVTLFTNTNTFILGIFAEKYIVGLFAIADKIVRSVIYLIIPICNAIFPKTVLLFSQAPQKALAFLRKVSLYGGLLFTLISISLFISSEFIVFFVSGQFNTYTANLVKIMSILPVSVFLDNIYGTQIMVNSNMKKQFMYILIVGGVLSVFFLLILVPPFKGYGAAFSFSTTELIILAAMYLFVRLRGIKLFKVF